MQLTTSRSDELLERRRAAVARGVSAAFPLFVERAEGALLWDVEGREYVDFAGGIGTLNLGHRHPRIVAAVAEQLERFTHTCFQVGMYDSYVELAERLNALLPAPGAKKSLLLSSGAEATENAVKIARAATGRPAVVAFSYGYHGRTLLALTMTGKVAPYRQNFGPYAPEIYHAPYPDARRGWDTPRALAALDELFATEVAAERVAAFIIEPVLGEGGFVPAPFEYLRELRRLADRHGILLIVDEVQTGFGRTGTMFAIEQAGVAPDLMVVAKSLAGGLPLSAVVGRAEIVDAVDPGGLGGTYAGNPLACAAALATLDAFDDEDVLARARAQGVTLRARLDVLARRFPAVVDVRGLGAMQAIEFAERSDALGRSLAQQVAQAAFERGVIVLTAGPKASALRFLIPLTASDTDVARGLDAVEAACEQVL
jgi:4-aminobutyrate aminotransferase/(S)-3-amino-2-methylpropionate transaminase